jgi:hypothetical protein
MLDSDFVADFEQLLAVELHLSRFLHARKRIAPPLNRIVADSLACYFLLWSSRGGAGS